MGRFWWWFRVALLSLVCVGLGAYLYATNAWRWRTPARYEERVAEGEGIVGAIYRFKAERGLWPEYLEDVAPEYLPKAPERGWFYDLQEMPAGAGGPRVLPSLSTAAPADGPRAHVGFDFDAVSPGWRVYGGAQDRVLRGGRPPTPPPAVGATTAAARVVENALAELDRRIEREKDVVEHRQGKAALLLSLGRVDKAREVVEEAAAALPMHFWPRLARAVLDMDRPGDAAGTARAAATGPDARLGAAGQAFAEWVRSHPTFTHEYYLWWLYQKAGEGQAAARAAEAALKEDLAVGPDDQQVPAFYLWDMGRWALRGKRWDLVMLVTTAWEGAQRDHALHEDSYLALRAAARLVRGDAAGARLDLAALTEAQRRGGRPWAQHLDALREAVERGDRGFRYDPGEIPGGLAVFPLPE